MSRAPIWLVLFASVALGCGGSDGPASAPSHEPSQNEGGSSAAGTEGAGGTGVGTGGSGGGDAPLSPIGPAGDFSEEVSIDGIVRTYRLYVPASAVSAM